MRFDIITIFPKIFDSYFNESIIKRAQKRKLIKINIHNLRDFTKDKHKTVDDKPYGGGFGMVLMVEPIYKAVKKIKSKILKSKKSKIILLSAKGKKFNQKMAQKFSKLDQIIIISGRYEGVDERVAKYVADEEISIGDYILTGGEIPAMILVDTITRLIPGVINENSLKEESFSKLKIKNCKLKINFEYPHYTRPEKIKIDGKERHTPKILLSGNHKKIKDWQECLTKIF
ncbi:MAG: tRNA (guanosine(37)-N1)-methyltransferase TrmD [Patescibacteria group bacterium]|nr:tRNA (guanosine(37)-N1)-methyltransferase TrmD [Patescibacteria group bacterium]